MIENKDLYAMAQSVGLSRMAFYHRAQRDGLTTPLSQEQFKKIALDVASSPRITDNQRKAILSLIKSDTRIEEKEHLPFFRINNSNQKNETRIEEVAPEIDFEIEENPADTVSEPETKNKPRKRLSETKKAASLNLGSPESEPSETKKADTKLSYAQIMGPTVSKINDLSWVLRAISALGVSFILYSIGEAFFTDPRLKVALGCFCMFAAWRWEEALKAKTSSYMNQVVYWVWGNWAEAVFSTIILLLLLGPNIYQGAISVSRLANVIAPVHIEDDGGKLNDKLEGEKAAIAASYEKARMDLRAEQETAALADPTVAKFAGFENSERRAAAARKAEGQRYLNKGEKQNANWCFHLARQAENKAEKWRVEKERASAAVIASYAAKFTDLSEQEKAERDAIEARYQGLFVVHRQTEGQLREKTEGLNKGLQAIGLIMIPVADLVLLFLVYMNALYFYRTNQVDPNLKEYKVVEKSKLEQFWSGLVGPAWDAIFAKFMRIGYHYQAMAQANIDRAEYVRKLKAEEAALRHEKYEQQIKERIELLRG